MISQKRKGPVTPDELASALTGLNDLPEEAKTGLELLDLAASEPTLDRFLDGSPKLKTPKDYAEAVSILQRKRAAFITAEQKRKEPKIEGED